MKKNCLHCKMPFVGRTDKKFCSTVCKNAFNSAQRSKTQSITHEVDKYLHRNRVILSLLMGKSKKEMFDKLILVRAGFKFEYMTGIYFNKENKMYRLVYDYAWMDFSDQKVLIIQKQNSK
jgi:hypothetical protein